MTKKTVLIVEDSIGFSELMQFVVEDEGYRGVVFPLEDNFIKWVDKEKPNAIIMDLALNRMNGFDFIHELKEHPKHKTIPVIVITGRDLSVKDIAELKLHDIQYLRKGRVDMNEIHRAIKECLEKEEKAAPAVAKTAKVNEDKPKAEKPKVEKAKTARVAKAKKK